MHKWMKTGALAIALLGMALLQGCATRVKADATTNPAPTEAFSAFGRIEMRPVTVASGAKAHAGAVAKIQQNLDKDLAAMLREWNARPDNGRKLTITPVVEQLEFNAGAKRVLLGPLAGSSGVLIKLQIRDSSGLAVATPQFFQRADAWAAGFVMGVHDNIMLTRVANLASAYVISNYAEAKGGPTGADAKSLGTSAAPSAVP